MAPSAVGKIYNLLAHRIAARVHSAVPGLEEVHVILCSRIGEAIDRPQVTSVPLVLAEGIALADVADDVHSVVERELAEMNAFVRQLAEEGLAVC